MNNSKKTDKEIIDSSPMGPAHSIQSPKQKKQESKTRKEPVQPPAPGDTI